MDDMIPMMAIVKIASTKLNPDLPCLRIVIFITSALFPLEKKPPGSHLPGGRESSETEFNPQRRARQHQY
ncbi:hypothetical protein [Prosthecobacter sp.]|uniref:hypothetical protein n=1 Tax=Prosthecobacter sp. TaxID=1965333 RepID=UPI003784C7B3